MAPMKLVSPAFDYIRERDVRVERLGIVNEEVGFVEGCPVMLAEELGGAFFARIQVSPSRKEVPVVRMTVEEGLM